MLTPTPSHPKSSGNLPSEELPSAYMTLFPEPVERHAQVAGKKNRATLYKDILQGLSERKSTTMAGLLLRNLN